MTDALVSTPSPESAPLLVDASLAGGPALANTEVLEARASGLERRRVIDAEETANEEAVLGKASPSDGTQFVTFLLNDEEFGFDIMSVQEIIRPPKMARLPQTPEYMEGVCNLRGSVLPIFDIRARFGMQRAKATDHTRVLVIDIDGNRTGLLVDGVRQVTRVAPNEFEAPPGAVRSKTTDYINGIVKLEEGGRIIIALDARRVCSQEGGTAANAFQVRRPALTEDAAGNPGASRTKGESMRQLVSFKVGGEEFAFPIEDVREILRVQGPKEVPGAPKHLLGVLTVRGQILPIVDLRRLLSLSSLAEDHIEGCRRAGAGYQTIVDRKADGATLHSWLQEASGASECLRQWLLSFNSSSQAMMETLAKVKRGNEQAGKAIAALGKERSETGDAGLQAELLDLAREILASLRTFALQVANNISEDQRIIVVDSNGFHLGLVVDHVNEVLSVQEEDIEAPPQAAASSGVNLSGIAKLDSGNRLILLLETGNLLDLGNLAALAKEHGMTRTQALKAQVEDPELGTAADELQVVTFLLGQEEYGIPIAKIQEIDRLSKVTQTPRAPKFVEGVTNLRGEVIPVLSTRNLFALESKVPDDGTRVIIVDLGGAKTGLVVDSVKEVMSISSKNIAPPPASISPSGGDGHFISGIGKVNDGKRMIVLLDVGKVLTRGEQSASAGMQRPA